MNNYKMKSKKRNNAESKIIGERIKCIAIVAFIFAMLFVSNVYATLPEGPSTISMQNSSRRTPASSQTLNAIAGNVSQISIYGTTVTQSWQGYYGNVSGNITLDDSSNNTLYNWPVTHPEGEIYASTSPIDFSIGNIACYNFTKSGGSYLNLTAYETSLGMDESNTDGINETFTLGTTYDDFYAGLNFINSSCPETQLFNSSEQKNPNQFQEVLLYDLTSNKVIFTSILEHVPVLGFNNQYWDFEMIVAEKGLAGDTETTTYYFYIEIE